MEGVILKKRFKDTAVNYRQANKWVKPKKFTKNVPDGTWFPISIVAHLTGLSHQTIRLLYLSEQIDGLKYPVGPLLVDLDQVNKLVGAPI